FPIQACGQCEKPICQNHGSDVNGVTLCTTCAKRGLAAEGGTSGGGHSSRRYRDSYHDDPYYYGPTYYSGYGRHSHRRGNSGTHDPDDFTEADAESMRHEGDEEFEHDMGES
ncbi:MAG: hypothetical protein N2C14_15645, partial [Planctomycetales bacterium]